MKKQYRIKKTQDIEKVIKNKKFSANPYFVIYRSNNPETSHYRYAISVSKKLGNAVERNRIKRQIKASIRELNLDTNPTLNFFIVARAGVLKLEKHEDFKEQLSFLLSKQKIKFKE